MSLVQDNNQPPEWMVALENKQRKHHKLAHDVGAGAPCLNCLDACLGLDLHFWRKLCRNCKCKKEDHDIKEDNGCEQFEILFGENGLLNNENIRQFSLKLENEIIKKKLSKYAKENDFLFDWIPQDVPANIASEYMQELPVEKLPIKGSEGAIFRRQQLEKQIPLHDFSVNKCHELSEEEAQAFTDYLQNLKDNVVGKGNVTKIMWLSNQLAAGDATYPDRQDQSLPNKSPFIKNLNITPKPFMPFMERKDDGESIQQSSQSDDLSHPLPGLKLPSAFIKPGIGKATPTQMDRHQTPENMDTAQTPKNELLPQSDKKYIDTTANLKPSALAGCMYQKENIAPESKVADQILKINSPAQFRATSSQPNNVLFSKSATPLKSLEKMDPKISALEEMDQLAKQLNNLSPNSYQFPADNLSMKCHQCNGEIIPGQIAVLAERAGSEFIWHPKCFVCHTCQELLVDLVYFFHEEHVYCGRHYAEVLEIPRCFACDELIFLKEYTVAEGQSFHVKHFCCFECDIPLAGMKYVPKDGHPVCLSCYNVKYGKKCQCCEKLIGAQDSRLGWKDLNWHATPECFKCHQCSKSLLGGQFVVKNDYPLCSKECVQQHKIRYNI